MRLVEQYFSENSTNLSLIINNTDCHTQTPTLFLKAIRLRDFILIERLLDIPNVDPNIYYPTKNNLPCHYHFPLFHVTDPLNSNPGIPALRYILAFPNLNINLTDRKKQTALFECSSELVPYLIKAGIDIHAIDEDGNTALLYALKNGEYTLAIKLMEYGANPNTANKNGDTGLHLLARDQTTDKLDAFEAIFNDPKLDSQFDYNIVDASGNTAYDILKAEKLEFDYDGRPRPKQLRILTQLKARTGDISQHKKPTIVCRTFEWRLNRLLKHAPDASELTTIPNKWLCPISLELMDDPIQLSNNQIYDRKSLHEWIMRGPTITSSNGDNQFKDPLTRIQLDIKAVNNLPSLHTLQSDIENFLSQLEQKYLNQELPENHITLAMAKPKVAKPTDVMNEDFLKGQLKIAVENFLPHAYRDRPETKVAMDDYIKQTAEAFFLKLIQAYPCFRPHNLVSIFFMDHNSSYIYRPDKLIELRKYALKELRVLTKLASRDVKNAIDKLIAATEFSPTDSAQDRAAAVGALWQTVFVLMHPHYSRFYGAAYQPLKGQPSRKKQCIGAAMLLVGLALTSVYILATIGTLGLALPAAFAITLVIGAGISGVGLSVGGIGLFTSNRRKNLASAVWNVADTIVQPLARSAN